MPSLILQEAKSICATYHLTYSQFLLILTAGVLLLHALVSTVRNVWRRRDGVPIVNQRFVWQPRWVSRLRWMFWAEDILEEAYQKYDGQVYRLDRGDVMMTVVPSHLVSELNRLPENVLNSRVCHVTSMIGWHNGMSTVLETNLHVKTLLSRVTPALPDLLRDLSSRISKTIVEEFPIGSNDWQVIEPLEKMARCTTQAVAFAGVGAPLCDDPQLLELLREKTINAFTIMFLLRALPAFLHSFVVWLLPCKWRLRQNSAQVQAMLEPELLKRRGEAVSQPNLVSYMISNSKGSQDVDPRLAGKLMAVLATGGIYSTGNVLVSILIDLMSRPEQLEEVRREIVQKKGDINGNWDEAAFNSLYKLDSAMKESVRLAPGSLLSYSRAVLQDYTMSNGYTLRKGDFICVNSYGRTSDPTLYKNPKQYDALRFYNHDPEYHATHPFKHSYSGEYRWGSGRWACSGRYLATMTMKAVMVKLLDEYEFKFVKDVRPPNQVHYEFVYIDAKLPVMCRRREEACEILGKV